MATSLNSRASSRSSASEARREPGLRAEQQAQALNGEQSSSSTPSSDAPPTEAQGVSVNTGAAARWSSSASAMQGVGPSGAFEPDRLAATRGHGEDLASRIQTSWSDTRAVGEALAELKDGDFTQSDVPRSFAGRVTAATASSNAPPTEAQGVSVNTGEAAGWGSSDSAMQGVGASGAFEPDRLAATRGHGEDLASRIQTSWSDTRAVGEALAELKDGGYTVADLEVMAEGRTGSPAMQGAARLVLAQAGSADPLRSTLEQVQAENAETQQSLGELMSVVNTATANGGFSPELRQDLARQLSILEGTPGTVASTAVRGDGSAAVREAYETASAYAQVDGQRLADALLTPELREVAAAPLDTAATALVREQGEIALPAADGLHALAEALRSGNPQEIAEAQAHASTATIELYQHTLGLGAQAQPDMTGSVEDRSLMVQVITAEGRAEQLADAVRNEPPEHGLQAVTDLRALSDSLETTSPALSEAIRESASQPVEALGQAVSLAREMSHVDVEQYVQAGLTAEQREAAAAPFEEAAKGLLEEQGPPAQAAADSLQAVASALRSGDAQDLTAAQCSAVAQTHDLAASVLEKASERLDTALAREHGESGARVLEVRATEVTANLEHTAAYAVVNPQEFAVASRTPEERAEAAMPLDAAASMLRETGDPAAERAAQSMEALAQELRTGDAKDIERAQSTMADEVTAYVERGRESANPAAEPQAQTPGQPGFDSTTAGVAPEIGLQALEAQEQLARVAQSERTAEADKAIEAEELSME